MHAGMCFLCCVLVCGQGMSVFLNSGAVMGSVPALVAMLQDVMATDEVKTYFSLRQTGDQN